MRVVFASLCVVLTASLNMEDMDSMNVCGVDAQQKGGAWSFKDCDGFTLFQIYLGPDGAEAVAAMRTRMKARTSIASEGRAALRGLCRAAGSRVASRA